MEGKGGQKAQKLKMMEVIKVEGDDNFLGSHPPLCVYT